MIFLLIALLFSTPAFADSLDNLIDHEKKDQEQWTQDVDTLPPAFLWGDKTAVEIYSPAAYEGSGNALCQPIEFDELIELSRGSPLDRETSLNLALPRVRASIQQACLIRPRDSVLAIGEGWQKRVPISDFVVRRDRAVCPQDSPFSLWGMFERPMEEAPIFFSTNDDWPEGDNGFLKLREIAPSDQEPSLRKMLAVPVQDERDFDLALIGVHATNVETICVLRRRTISLDDDQLPNEMLFYKSGDTMEKLWSERVDVKKGSGHLRVDAMLDYNRDGFIDLIVSGDHNGCPYKIIFEGMKSGFSRLDLPLKPCVCQ